MNAKAKIFLDFLPLCGKGVLYRTHIILLHTMHIFSAARVVPQDRFCKFWRMGHFAGWKVGSMSLWVILQAGKIVV